MDVVYPYRRAPSDLELRFSLRSLANMPHDSVIVAGEAPTKLSKAVRFVPVPRRVNRYDASTHNILMAAKNAVKSENFIVMNDDIFILEPWECRHEHRCSIDEYLTSGSASGAYLAHVISTRDILLAHGVKDPLFFGLHTPTVYNRDKLIDLVTRFKGRRFLLRTLYHNLSPEPSARREDVKVRQWTGEVLANDVLSISDGCARDPRFIEWISARFPDPSPYEAVKRREIAA